MISFVPSSWSGAADVQPILIGPVPPIYPHQELPPIAELRVVNNGDFPAPTFGWRLLINQPAGVDAYGLTASADGVITNLAPGTTQGLGTWAYASTPPSFETPGSYPAHLWLEVAPDDAILANNILDFTIEVIPFIGSITFTTTSLPPATVGVPYSCQLQATGAPNITFEGTSPFLSVSPEGLLTGTLPSAGNYPIMVRASNDPAYEAATMTLSWRSDARTGNRSKREDERWGREPARG